ncbi:TonB-dependent receptor [Haoranjiania flava]|uniref:TonB-dependent receptor n=1 Tax=Haoranjiania flava TaxID=1856322 RepID=A0AAE3LKG2_9BACT|nr:TonB-dependent receptor [Haoranjiania flava]MCU7694364.1 TonB-dependent receptor [Haoranjiania flava]
MLHICKMIASRNRLFVCLLSIFTLPALGYSQKTNPAITIVVADADNDTLIANAEVRSNFFKQRTNDQGAITIQQYRTGSFHVHAEADEYYPADKHFFIRDSSTTFRIELHPLKDTLHAIEITGYRAYGNNKTSTAVLLTDKELEKTRGSSLAGLLQTVPGISMIQTGATIAKPVINGMHSNRILILNNGVKLEGQQWGADHAPEVDPNIARNIVVVKGADAVRYGAEAMGGVILINPPKLPYGDPALHGEADLTGASNGRLYAAGMSLSSGIRRFPSFAWRLQGSGKKAGNIRSADYFLENTGIHELNFSAAAGIRKERFSIEVFGSFFSAETGIFKGAHIGDTTSLFARIRNEVPFEKGSFYYNIDAPRQRVFHELYKAQASYQLPDGSLLHALYAYQQNKRREYDLRRAGRDMLPSLDLRLNAQNADLSWEKRYAANWKSTLGINGFYKSNVNVPGTGVTPLIPNFVQMGSSVYAIQKLTKTNLEAEAGLRYDYQFLNSRGSRAFYKYVNEQGEEIPADQPGGNYIKQEGYYGGEKNFSNISAILGALFKLSPEWHISSNAGLAWRPPQVNELYSYGLHHGSASVERGDSALTSEKSYKWINTVYHYGQNLSFEISGYGQVIRDYIYLEPSMQYEQSIRGAFPVFQYRQTHAMFLGADLGATYRFSKAFTYELKASLVRAKDLTNKKYLHMIPADKLSNGITWNIGNSKSFKDNYFQIESVLTAKQNRYEPQSDFAPPPSGYHLVNIALGTRMPLGSGAIKLNAAVSNLFNTLYKEYLNRFRYYSHDIGRNIQLRMSYEF